MANRVYRAIPSSAGQYEHMEPGRAIPRFEGVVRAIGLHEELYAVVEVPKGYPRYVQVPPDVGQTIRVGDKVAIGSAPDRWVKPSDERIVRFAQGNHGVYDLDTHQRALEEGRRRAPEGGPTRTELVGANIRRLERLERYGLAERQANGCWRVPPDLIAKLEARAQSHPGHALRVEIQRSVPERAVDSKRTIGDRPANNSRSNYA